MATLIKICGLTTREAVDTAVAAGADMVGFVFFAPSPRHIELAAAAALIAALPDNVLAVALTVDADDRLIDDIAAAGAGLIQAHGRESPARVAEIAGRSGLPVMKVVAVSGQGDVAAAMDYSAVAGRLLFDARPPARATRPGGHGAAFDWRLVRSYAGPLPWMLSGGLTAENVAAAIAASGAPGVDVSSGVERESGVKDPRLIRRFIAAAREAGLAAGARA
jgi:phosphoribosylanthranilate isomerase